MSSKQIKSVILMVALTVFFSSTVYAADSSPVQFSVSIRNDLSEPLSEMAPRAQEISNYFREIERLDPPFRVPFVSSGAPVLDPNLQNWHPEFPSMPDPLVNFEGVSNVDGIAPPDTNGDVGLNHYMQWINLSFAIWDKSGNLLLGPLPGNTFFSGFGGVCETTNHGDPVVLYDHLADRWFVTQFSVNTGNYHQCVAVSQTGNPTGAYYRYDFQWPGGNVFPDYGKFGVWPDGYYMMANQFSDSAGFTAVGVAAFERDQMLLGNPAQMVYFDLGAVNEETYGLLPADLDGPAPAPGTPNYFVYVYNPEYWGGGSASIQIWEYIVDWANPGNSTFGIAGTPNEEIAPAAFSSDLCSWSRDCIPQPDISQRLDTLAGMGAMYRLQYRHFDTHDSMVFTNTVDADGTDHAGVRWYELRDEGAGWFIQNQGTYAPDADHRWMAGIAMDSVGNLALGYSVSSASTYPSIRYTGRLAGDPADTMTQGEATIIAGTGSQSNVNRWGDYSMMSVDPTDDCTFWYTQEYVQTTGSFNWQTRVASFKFDSCTAGPTGSMDGFVYDNIGDPLSGARVEVGSLMTLTGPDGYYQINNIPVGTYDATASAYGFSPDTQTDVGISEDITTTLDFNLSLLPASTVFGVVRDANYGWPLYAALEINDAGHSETVFTDPETGEYTVELLDGQETHFTVIAFIDGYNVLEADVTPAGDPFEQNFDLAPDSSCDVPGYDIDQTYYFGPTDFEADNGGFTASGANSTWEWGIPASGPGGAHSGSNAWATNLSGDYAYDELSYLTSPVIDLSGVGDAINIEWWQYLDTESNYDYAGVQVTNDGGGSWDYIYGPIDGSVSTVWTQMAAALDPSYAVSDFQFRFVLDTDYSITEYGFYVDDVVIASQTCIPNGGSYGVLVGNAYDANTLEAMNGVWVSDEFGVDFATVPTPDDPGVDDGFYSFITFSGMQTIEASVPTLLFGDFIGSSAAIDVPVNNALLHNINFLNGILEADPDSLYFTVLETAPTDSAQVLLANPGTANAQYNYQEYNFPYLAAPTDGPFAAPCRHLSPKKMNVMSLDGVNYYLEPPDAPTLLAGEVIQSWDTGIPGIAWGIGYDLMGDALWVGDAINHILYNYYFDGAPIGDAIDISDWTEIFAADIALNPYTGMLWQVNVGGDNCIYELDTNTLSATGNTICPPFGASQRGLAYDVGTMTFFAGSWNDSTIYRFGEDGVILESVNVGLAIAGLAFNPMTNHLFVSVQSEHTNSVYVLDVADGYSILGSFPIVGVGDYEQAALELDMSGRLWIVNQATNEVIQIDPGEPTGAVNIPWLEVVPDQFLVPIDGADTVDFNVDAAGMEAGVYEAHVKFFPYSSSDPISVPVTLEVLAVHTITAASGSNGSLDPEGVIEVVEHNNQLFDMVPGVGFEVDDVQVDGTWIGAMDSYTFTNVTEDHAIYATFTLRHLTITAAAGPGGQIDPSGDVDIFYGGSRSFDILPDADKLIVDVIVDGVSVGAVATYDFINVTEDREIEAFFAECIEGADCDDGIFCNGEEICDEGVCAPGTEPDCDDDLWCTGVETCDVDADECVSEFGNDAPRCADDGEWCNGEESCDEQNDECVSEFGDEIPRCEDDSLFCTGEEYCDEENDECDHQEIPECPDDELWCNGEEYCDEENDECDHQEIPECPDDELWCNGEEYCDEENDECASQDAPECPDDELWCNGEEYCDEENDECDHQDAPECPDDELWCNGEEYCDEENDECASEYGDESPRCEDDALFCTGEEQCDEENDQCISSGNPCEAGEICGEEGDECLSLDDDSDDDDSGSNGFGDDDNDDDAGVRDEGDDSEGMCCGC
jgi:Carboxypeptidase regulatory-like domain